MKKTILCFVLIALMVLPTTIMARQPGKEVNPLVNGDYQTTKNQPTDRWWINISINFTTGHITITYGLNDVVPLHNVTIEGTAVEVRGRCFVGKTFSTLIPTIEPGVQGTIKAPLQIGLGIMDYHVNVTSGGITQTYGPDRCFLLFIKPINMKN
jgi:hypothetical protein